MDKKVVVDGASQKLREDPAGSDLQFLESLFKQSRISLLVYQEETETMEKDEEDQEEDRSENNREDHNQDHNPDNMENKLPHADLFPNKCAQHK